MAAPWASIVVGVIFIIVWSLFWKWVIDLFWTLFGEEIIRSQMQFEEWWNRED